LTELGLRSVATSHPEYRDILNYAEMLRYRIMDSTHSRSLPISFPIPLDLTVAHAFTVGNVKVIRFVNLIF